LTDKLIFCHLFESSSERDKIFEMTQIQRPVAFFDIDGTVFRSSLLVELVEALVKEEIFPRTSSSLY